LRRVSRFAETIDRVAGHIEEALLASDEPPENPTRPATTALNTRGTRTRLL
jgi:hypothetical protein